MGLHSEVVKDGALSARKKELMMVGIAVALRCEYCLWKHVLEAVNLGATREEVMEASKYCNSHGRRTCGSLWIGSCP